MSTGLISLRLAPKIPSTTTSGLVFSLSKLLRPLILISKASPGLPAVFVTTTPAICP